MTSKQFHKRVTCQLNVMFVTVDKTFWIFTKKKKTHKKGVYSDVHDQQDFTKYCQVFLTQLQELDKNSLIPNHPPPILKNGENHSSILCMMSQPLLLRLVFGLMPLHRLFTTSHWVPQSWCQIFFDYQ